MLANEWDMKTALEVREERDKDLRSFFGKKYTMEGLCREFSGTETALSTC